MTADPQPPVRLAVDPWAPEFEPAIADDLEPSSATVDEEVEMPVASWRGLAPPDGLSPARPVAFVDGVRRVDARVWLTADDGAVRGGICASFAAGVIRCDNQVEIERIEVRRGLISTAGAPPVDTGNATYAPMAVASDDTLQLTAGLQQRMRELEVAVAREARDDAELLVVDGPLRERQDLANGVGYVKTHRVGYLSPAANDVVARLEPGQRTPLFVTQTSWSRYSWYLRLPGGSGHPWAGVVRCEASADLPLARVRELADRCAATLVRYASEAHKDRRAPQNLYPIGGLERELRRRLGDPALLYRSLRGAQAGA